MSNLSFNYLIMAAQQGDALKVRELMHSPEATVNKALQTAAGYGQTSCVAVLLEVADAKADNNNALQLAASIGSVECVALLIPVSSPQDNAPLLWACINGHHACVDLLYDVCDPYEALQWFQESKEYSQTPTYWQYLRDKYDAECQKLVLNGIVDQNRVRGQRKI